VRLQTLRRRRGKFRWWTHVHSKVFVEWFKSLSLEDVRSTAEKHPMDFLWGFYLSEGSYHERKRGRGGEKVVEMVNTDPEVLSLASGLLRGLGFHPRRAVDRRRRRSYGTKPLHHLRLHRREEVERFINHGRIVKLKWKRVQ